MPLKVLFALSVWFLGLALATFLAFRWLAARRKVNARFLADAPSASDAYAEDELGWLARWLFVAGFRSPRVTYAFVGLTLLCAGCGAAVLWLFPVGAAVGRLAKVMSSMPGGVGEVLVPLVLAAPWMIVAILVVVPTLAVRAARRRRVRQVEQDLPIVLELLATLAEAGLGLDAAIDRVLESLPPRRVLAEELRAFQRDNLAGRPRIDSLRWLGRRVAVSWFSIFISAVVQADQIGSGLAEVLKIQAEDLRQRRKEQALALASSAPVKLLVPLILCFIPGIVTAALGPTLFEVLQTLDSLLLRPMR